MYGGALMPEGSVPGSGPIWLDDVQCTGLELTLLNCTHRGWAVENCGHGEDLGITCNITSKTWLIIKFKLFK
jgi:hypothetical protein